MKNFFQILLGTGILAAAGVAVYFLWLNKPVAKVADGGRALPVVEVVEMVPVDRKMEVSSQGIVEPRKVTQVAAEVTGRVVSVSERFYKGGEFLEGETMLKIDPSDYLANVAQAEASLAEAKLNLETEEARALQARRDWESLGRSGLAKDLTLRKPQLASARAREKAAGSALEKARRDLARTEIKAPFKGRIREIDTEQGAYLVPGSPVADYYTTEPYELRMPVALDDLRFVKNVKRGGVGAGVEVDTVAGGEVFTWTGQVIRNESEIERESRSIYLVALLEGRSQGDGVRLQPGLFVQARIEGEVLEDAFEVPMKAFQDLEHVLVVDDKNRIRIREVRVARREGDLAIVSNGLKRGERLCLTALVDVIEGMEVKVAEKRGDDTEGESPALPPST